MRSPARLLLIGLALPLALLGQPGSVTPTNSALTVNTSTGAVVAPVNAATFRSANDLQSASGAASSYQPLDADLTSWAALTRASGFDAFVATPSSANLRSLLSDEVGTGAAYFVGGALGTPASGTLTNATGLPVSTGLAGLGTNVATWLATPSSANLAAALTDETGTGAAVFASSPTLVTPALGAASATSINVTGDIDSTNTTTGSIATLGGLAAAKSVSVGATLAVGAAAIHSTQSPIRLRSDQNVNMGVYVDNLSSGSGASANLILVSNGGLASFRMHSQANAVWPDTLLLSTDANVTNGIVVATGAGAAPIVLQTNFAERLRISDAGLRVGTGGTHTDLIASATATLDFGSISAAGSADLTITVTGASVGDSVALGLPATPASGIVWNAFVSAANTVTVRASNITGSAVDPASATYRATVLSF